ncbi:MULTISPECIES: 2Fe-2S iron-sulfur cluster-binding protein [Aminobacter]|jgi:2Fe-2S ferredoxin|uniref:2Fe-2S ferredoxin n=1 Tax=Aminobacter ciceronei TaxID=150723 RepID=A0ABR6CDD7_9HYPH|nr:MULTISPECIES: 2Fe-2S iron-sulfur cluster-binding protein [Aminobacter]MBA8909270.1 2Fe-2S ferredoxin [Aminobacter ciceronei]MBA9023042.1 2Fe-2S ferredoxin [Aminobacter ciceronei]WMC97883.1 2Fe-2S iron-sulfur cluster-binding protein [Aminobacter aminovorans]BBD35973.1 (2Fe-2S) ferredoxin [Aminobacter sp. SS-2016]
MIEINFTEADGNRRILSADPGSTLLNAILGAGIKGIVAECGGGCSCGTCHVHVALDWTGRLPAPADDETDMLSLAEDVTEQSRLACQIRLAPELNGLSVAIPGAA